MGLVGILKGMLGCAAKALLLYSPFRRFLCVFVSITLINGLFEVNCLEVTKCPLMVAADQEAAARKSSPATKAHKRISLDGTIFSSWVSARDKVKGILVVHA